MKKYAIAYVNLFDNDLKLIKVKANDEVSAIKTALVSLSIAPGLSEEEYAEIHSSIVDYVNSLPDTVEEIKNEVIQTDTLIEIIEI